MFCCMPDHIHLLWIGVLRGSDQRVAMKHFRKHLNDVLQVLGVRLQNQSYDHVLKDEERQEAGFEALADYIARNPERAGLVEPDGYAQYPYTSCLIPGYPELKPFQSDYWPRFWRAYSFMAKNGLMRLGEPNRSRSRQISGHARRAMTSQNRTLASPATNKSQLTNKTRPEHESANTL